MCDRAGSRLLARYRSSADLTVECLLERPAGGCRSLLSRALCSCRRQAPAWPTMRDELRRASFPGLGKRKRTAGRARNRQGLEAGRFEIFVEHADRIVADHILWSRDGVRGNRNAAGQRFELNDAECVGSAREHECVRRRKMSGQGFPFQLTEKVGVRKTALQLAR